ncbi:hypothetical protein M422DRAFT_51440 [Sphaerobolus stellatus SS14]|uniref:Uncharacterized protein n=1 Tax=Sphaerobolus stellatus (strain SS14) TaxID=990650 RepID=A0A0C9UKZ1_SPHS4|nr:hypothetical protein M422DRAFT_51440 [Sphaerobolus stellatus SS14]
MFPSCMAREAINGDHDDEIDLRFPLICLVVFDGLIFALACGRALYLRSYYSSSTAPLMEVIVRDGGLYFVALLLENSINLALAQACNINIPALTGNMHLSGALTCVLVSRLFLNLRLLAYRSERLYTNPNYITRSLGLGTLGAARSSRMATYSRFLPDFASFTEFHVILPGFDTYLLQAEDAESID